MLASIRTCVRLFAHDEKGATAIEYGLIAAFVSLALLAGVKVAGPALGELFNTIGTSLEGARTAASTGGGT